MKRSIAILLMVIFLAVQLLNIGGFGYSIVNADTTPAPDFSISRTIDKQTYNQGEIAKITYTITPTGKLTVPVQSNCDIVLIMDTSTGMAGSKLTNAKSAAINFINKIKAANANNKIGFVTFGYKVNKTIPLTTDLNSITSYIQGLKDSSLISGSNFQDAFEKSEAILSSGTAPNKYIVFLSDGEPNYFNSNVKIKQYEKNEFKKYENGVYYYTSFPAKTEKAYNNAFDKCKDFRDKKIIMYSIGLGTGDEVDMHFLEKMSKMTGGTAYQAFMPDSLISVFTQISNNITNAKISNLVIYDKLPAGISVVNGSTVVPDSNGNISIALPDIIFPANGPTPSAFTYVLELNLNNAGTYVMNNARIDYKDINSVPKSKPINSLSFSVNPNIQKPGLTASKQIDKTQLYEGESATLTYTLTPTGSFFAGDARKAKDIVLLIDKSYGMTEDDKIANAKQAAEDFINIFKSANQGDKISVITFNRYARVESTLTTNYDSLINKIRGIQTDDGYSFDSGTNIELGLRTAQEILQGGSNEKQIILLSDGVPTNYLDSINTSNWVTYYYYPNLSYGAYIPLDIPYWYWYYNGPSNKGYLGSSMLDYGLKYGEYSYQQGNNRKGYEDTLNIAASIENGNIAINTVCVGGSNSADEEFMEEIAEAGGGKAYSTDTPEELIRLFEDIAKGISFQKLSNIVITETLPANVEILPSDRISINGNTVTIKFPDIIFEKNKGTPSPITVSFNIKFNTEGEYQLSNVSKVDYLDYKGIQAAPINLEKLTVTVMKGAGELQNVDIKAIDGSKQVKVIKKGKFDAIVTFDVVKKGKLSLLLNAPAGSEELYNSLSIPTQITDQNGNNYKLTKTAEGIMLTTNQPLQIGSYSVPIKFTIGNIAVQSYYLQIDMNQGAGNPKLRVDVVTLPIIL